MPSVFGRKLKREEKLYSGCMFSFNVGTLVTIYCVFKQKKSSKRAGFCFTWTCLSGSVLHQNCIPFSTGTVYPLGLKANIELRMIQNILGAMGKLIEPL